MADWNNQTNLFVGDWLVLTDSPVHHPHVSSVSLHLRPSLLRYSMPIARTTYSWHCWIVDYSKIVGWRGGWTIPPWSDSFPFFSIAFLFFNFLRQELQASTVLATSTNMQRWWVLLLCILICRWLYMSYSLLVVALVVVVIDESLVLQVIATLLVA